MPADRLAPSFSPTRFDQSSVLPVPCKKGCAKIGMSVCSSKTVHLNISTYMEAKFWSWLPRIEKASKLMKYHRDKHPFTIQAWAACNPQSPTILAVWPPSLGGKTWSTPESHLRVADGISEVVIGWNPLHGTSKYNFISQIPTFSSQASWDQRFWYLSQRSEPRLSRWWTHLSPAQPKRCCYMILYMVWRALCSLDFFGINVGYAQHIPELWSLWEYIIITTSWRVYDVRKNGSRNHHEPPEHWADIAVLKLIDLQSGYRYWKPPENNQNIPKQLGSWQIKDEDFNFSTTCGQAWRMTMVSALVLQHRASLYLIDIRGRSWGLQWFWGVTDVESFPNLWQAMPALAISLQGKC